MLTVLDPNQPEQPFPSASMALEEPDGLLAIGGCLSPQRLINAYRNGIFPWYNPDSPLLWWSPNPRLVLFPEKLQISRSLRKTMRQQRFSISFDKAFSQVITACAEPRKYEDNTWISSEMQDAYYRLHQLGIAHSVESWLNGELVGGLYGIALGKVFFGESMFHYKTDASKVAFASLIEKLSSWEYELIDCQVHTEHLMSLGAEKIFRDDFLKLLSSHCPQQTSNSAWEID